MEARGGRQDRTADALTSVDLVVREELGDLPFAQCGGRLVFHRISRLHERASTIVTSNLDFAEWPSPIADARRRTARLGRLTHHGDTVETGKHSWRFRNRT